MKMRDGELRSSRTRAASARQALREAVCGAGGDLVTACRTARRSFRRRHAVRETRAVFGQQTAGGVLPALFERLPNGDVLGTPLRSS